MHRHETPDMTLYAVSSLFAPAKLWRKGRRALKKLRICTGVLHMHCLLTCVYIMCRCIHVQRAGVRAAPPPGFNFGDYTQSGSAAGSEDKANDDEAAPSEAVMGATGQQSPGDSPQACTCLCMRNNVHSCQKLAWLLDRPADAVATWQSRLVVIHLPANCHTDQRHPAGRCRNGKPS